MRFCLVSTQAHWGGGEALLASIATYWVQAGHSVSCIVRQAGEVEQHALASGATVLHTMRGRGSNLADWWSIRRALREWSPDVIILNDSHAVPLVGSAALFCRSPRPLRLAYKHTVFPLHSALKYRLLCDKLVCVSQAAEQVVLSAGVPRRHTTVVHGGCVPIDSDPTARAQIRAELQLADHQRLLVSVGSLLECKGHRELVEAIALLASSHSELVAVIAGEGEERDHLETLIARRGLASHVRLLGYRNDASRLLDAADVVVHPSHAEGLSLVLIQAQMLCKPIVATSVGGAAEVLAAGSADCSAWIAQPHNPQDLAQQLSLALASLDGQPPATVQKLQATSARMREQFTVTTTATQLATLAAEMLE